MSLNDSITDSKDKSLKSTNVIEDGEIIEIDGIEVWGQKQVVLEQQALSHLESLQKSQGIEEKLDVEVNNEVTVETVEKNECETKDKYSELFDVNKFIENQEKNKLLRETLIGVSEKSKQVAKKISDLCLQKIQSSKRKKRNDSEGSKHSNEDFECGNSGRKRKKSNVESETLPVPNVNAVENNHSNDERKRKKSRTESETSNISDVNNVEIDHSNDDTDYHPSDAEGCDSDDSYKPSTSTKSVAKPRKRSSNDNNHVKNKDKIKDDGKISNYESRLQSSNFNTVEEKTIVIKNNLKIIESVWQQLYSYQKSGVKWLWNLHKQKEGGLLGDEMGLGKTVQVIVFLAALKFSQIKSSNGSCVYDGLGPTLIVCPATVIHQWLKHFQQWWPPFRVVLLHKSGSHNGSKQDLVKDVNKNNGIIITTYESVVKYKDILLTRNWHYLILDEGHKIRNPNAKVTLAVKEFRTPFKLILTGSPMQNNLQELWSLFDFIVPGKLGSLPVFMEYFASPITQGGFINATPTQETTALLIAKSLKDIITPYILRRTKDEVQDCIFLPCKSEQVLFCSLTDEQRDLYRGYLLSDHVGGILGRVKSHSTFINNMRSNILIGITNLRKICNHPDLYLGEADEYSAKNSKELLPEQTFGYYKRSGKMIVVAKLLKMWKSMGHRVLLFTQSRAMIEILENFLQVNDYNYLKMDGTTNISCRQPLIEKFNTDSSYHVFLLTTRVGGLGINLIGADRVIIYDPDWNPATDLQARERAWRIGQQRDVTIYRLVSAGTIEEKIYQRQIWKQLLSNKILIDPTTDRFFKSSDLQELFSLQENVDRNPETANIFKNSKVKINLKKRKKRLYHTEDLDTAVVFTEDKIQAMKIQAQEIAKRLCQEQQMKNEKEEQKQKLEENEAEKMKDRPTPAELLAANRMKLLPVEKPIRNEIDDKETKISFDEALETVTDPKPKHDNNLGENNNYNSNQDETKTDGKDKSKEEKKIEHRSDKHKKNKIKVDESGEIDGEKVEGLIKREIKKREKIEKRTSKNNDDYVLGKLLAKKGVQTALEHDVIVQGRSNKNNLKIRYEANVKVDIALKALRKSRLESWRW